MRVSILPAVVLVCVALLVSDVDAKRRKPGGRPRPGGKPKPGHGHGHGHRSLCTCADDSEIPVEVFTGTTAGADKKTVCVKKELCYYVCATDPCTSITRECIDKDTAAKPGNCPAFAYPKFKNPSEDECTDDSTCKGQEKCCKLSPHTFNQCVEPVGTGDKCGTCPANSDSCTVDAEKFEVACDNDAQCPGPLRCCECGTSKKCRKPASTSELA